MHPHYSWNRPTVDNLCEVPSTQDLQQGSSHFLTLGSQSQTLKNVLSVYDAFLDVYELARHCPQQVCLNCIRYHKDYILQTYENVVGEYVAQV